MLKVYRFEWDCGRQGNVEGVFVADDAEVAAAIGKEVGFGEILGKHSDVQGVLEENDLTVLSTDAAFCAAFQEHVGTAGYNPLDYLGNNR